MVMPLYDDNPFSLPHRPIMTWSLIVANIAVFLIQIGATDNPNALIYHFGVTPASMIGEYRVPGAISPFLTLITYQFFHADVVHILGNMVFLWVYGDNVEEAMGRMRFLIFYLACGVVGAV